MVNLAKLRKKAKEKKEKKEESGAPAAPPAAGVILSRENGEGSPPEGDPSRSPALRMTPEPLQSANRIADYVAHAGEARGAAASTATFVEAGQSLELLSFVIAGEQYAIDIDEVVEIVTPRPVTRVPNADDSVVGIFSLRGTVVMLVDARRRLGHPPGTGPTADARVVVMKHDDETVGFLVDRVMRVTRADATDIEPHPVVHSSEHDESVRGVFRQGDALTIVLDLRKLLFTAWN